VLALYEYHKLTQTGRVSTNGFIPRIPQNSTYRDTLSSNLNPISPEEVLFRQKAATPEHLHEEVYFADRNISPNQHLPDSDLLKAIHTYSSDYYARATVNGGLTDWRSLDETALLAMGLLLEEAARHSLGETGDMVFVEGGGEELPDMSPIRRTRRKGSTATQSNVESETGGGQVRSKKRRRSSTNTPESTGEPG
jgi:hypothetical protein